jgi:hypothetical protein
MLGVTRERVRQLRDRALRRLREGELGTRWRASPPDIQPTARTWPPPPFCRASGGVYDVELEDGTVAEASLRGRLKLEQRTGDRVVAGDRARRIPAGRHPHNRDRSSRAAASWHARRPAAAAGQGHRRERRSRDDRVRRGEPDPNRRLLDRFLVLAEANRSIPLIVLNKLDLVTTPPRRRSSRRTRRPATRRCPRVCDGRGSRPAQPAVRRAKRRHRAVRRRQVEPAQRRAARPRPAHRRGERSSEQGPHTTVSARSSSRSSAAATSRTRPGSASSGSGASSRRDAGLLPRVRRPHRQLPVRPLLQPHARARLRRARGRRCGQIDRGRFESYCVLRFRRREQAPALMANELFDRRTTDQRQ